MTPFARMVLAGAVAAALFPSRVAWAEVPESEEAWRRIAGRDRRPVRDETGWSDDRAGCENRSWFECVEACRAGAINACEDLPQALSRELPAPENSLLSAQLSTVADALDKAQQRFDAACRQTPSVALACDVVRQLTFARYRLACRYAAPTVSDSDGSALRDGACRGVVRLLEDSSVSSDEVLLDNGLSAAREYCRTPDALSLDTCALMISVHAREARLQTASYDPFTSSSRPLLEVARSVCARVQSRSAPSARRVWGQLCNSLIEQRAWSGAVVQGLCATSDPPAFEACASVTRGYELDTSVRDELPTLAGDAPSPTDTQWFDGPIGIALESRLGAEVAFNPRLAPWQPRALAASVGVGARIRWHWLEVVAGFDVHTHVTLEQVRVQLALDFVLQPGVVIVTSAARPTNLHRVFTASTGVVLRGGPAVGAWNSDPWIGAVGGYARIQWHASSRNTFGGGLQAEITAPTWAAGDPSFALRGILSF